MKRVRKNEVVRRSRKEREIESETEEAPRAKAREGFEILTLGQAT